MKLFVLNVNMNLESVLNIESKVVAMTRICVPAGSNNGKYDKLIVLTSDGKMFYQYHSNGQANVPTEGEWYKMDTPI